jgi:hypothetical protein
VGKGQPLIEGQNYDFQTERGLADTIVIVIIESSRLIYGRNVRCWRQADLPAVLSVRDRLPLHSRWMTSRHVVRRSIMGFRSLTVVQAMPDGAGRNSSAADKERCVTWDQRFVGNNPIP